MDDHHDLHNRITIMVMIVLVVVVVVLLARSHALQPPDQLPDILSYYY